MVYDHSKKIGNQGDLVKHVALFAALRHLIDRSSPQSEFVYADIHAGRPMYVLPPGGEWRHGIGAFTEKPLVIQDLTGRRQGHPRLRSAGAYASVFLEEGAATGTTYHGSSGIALRLLKSSSIPWRMELWERDPMAVDDIKRHPLGGERDRIRVVMGNGYDLVKSEEAFSLVLIDPPALEAKAVLETMDCLTERGVSFVCWTPRTSRSVKPRSANERWSAAEAGTSSDFIRAARLRGSCLPVRWHEWGHRTPGCCITVSADLAEVALDAVSEVTEIMGWKLNG